MGANIPGKPREQLIYLAGVDVYGKEIRAALDGWKGFNVTMPAQEEKKGVESKEESKGGGVEAKIEDLNLTQGIR